MIFINELNDEQLKGLADLSFDLAKGAFALAVFPIIGGRKPIEILAAAMVGVAFTYAALILLKLKGKLA